MYLKPLDFDQFLDAVDHVEITVVIVVTDVA